MVTVLFATALLLYVGASASMAALFAGGRTQITSTGTAMLLGALIVHACGLIAFTAVHAELPLVGLAPSLCTLAFLITLVMVATKAPGESRPLGLVLAPLSALLLAAALVLGIAPAGQPLAFSGVWFSLHVLFAFIGYAGLAVAFAAGLVYLLQFRELKDKRLGRVFRFFPSLPALDQLGRRGLAVGFPSLTVALLLGWAWTVRFRGTFASDNPQVIWGVVTWLAFAVVFGLRLQNRAGSERRAALASVLAFVVVVTAYLALRLSMGGRAFL